MSQPAYRRRKSESPKAFRAFEAFKNLGLGRTIRAAAIELELSEAYLSDLATKHDWHERARAWDNFEAELREREHIKEIKMWEGRRREALKRRWERAQRLADRAAAMAGWPLAEETVEKEKYPDGRPHITYILKPIKWTQRDAVEFHRLAAQLEDQCFAAAPLPAPPPVADMTAERAARILRAAQEGDDDYEPPGV